jgi:hypothetical protein
MIYLHNAVYALYPNAVTVRGNDADELVAVDANEATIALDKSAITAKMAELEAAQVAAEQAAVTAKASALAKLTALGLTENEVKALIG